ncbi:MAG: hypothetical protein AAFY88_26535, partial [Acidobacteriota bacterium]
MLKVLFVSRRPAYPFFQGGAERSFFELAKALAAGGHWAVIYGECREPPQALEAYLPERGAAQEEWLDDRATVRGREVPSRLMLVSRPAKRLESLNTFLADFRRPRDQHQAARHLPAPDGGPVVEPLLLRRSAFG